MRFALFSMAAILAFSFNSFADDFAYVTRTNLGTGVTELLNPDGDWQLIGQNEAQVNPVAWVNRNPGLTLEGPGGGRPTLGGGGVIPVDWPVTGADGAPNPILTENGRKTKPRWDDGRGIKPIAFIPGEVPLLYSEGAYLRPCATYDADGYRYFGWQL